MHIIYNAIIIESETFKRGPKREVSSFSMRILDYAAGGLAQKAQDCCEGREQGPWWSALIP